MKDMKEPKNMGELIQEVRALQEARTSLVEQHGMTMLQRVLLEFFQRYPNVDAIRWTQYTPYFNDGEPCYFSVNEPSVLFSDLTESEHKYADENWIDSWNYPSTRQETFHAIPGFYDEEMLRQMFGDHAQVTISRNGEVTVEEYSHD